MKKKVLTFFDFIIYWSIVLIPFVMAIAPAPMNIFMGFLIFAFLAKKALSRRKISFSAAVTKPYLLFFIVSLISVFNSVDYHDSLRGLLKLAQYLLVFLIIAEEIRDKKHTQRIIISMILGMSLVSIDALWQVAIGRDFIRGRLPIINIGLRRATASFPDANVLGIYLSAIIPLVLGLTLYYFRNGKKIAMSLFSILVLTGLLLTFSRPSLLALYVSLLFLGIVRKDRIIISALIVLVVIAPFLLPAGVKDFARQVNYNPLRFMCNDDRIAIYRNSFNMIRHHPIVGVGVNTFMKNYKAYKESPEYLNTVTADYMYAHNNFIHMAAETGLLGLAVFFWFLFRLFKEIINIYRDLKDKYYRLVLLALSACLIAFLINGLTESSLYYSRVALIFWYLVGFSLAFGKFADVSKD